MKGVKAMTEADITNMITNNPDATGLGAILGLGIGLLIFVSIISIALAVLEIVGLWKSFNKAGQHGWAAIIPFYNIFVLIRTAKMEWWHFLIVLAIACVTGVENTTVAGLASLAFVVYWFVINIKFAKAFGKGAGLGIVCTLFPYIGYMIVGCGSAQYQK